MESRMASRVKTTPFDLGRAAGQPAFAKVALDKVSAQKSAKSGCSALTKGKATVKPRAALVKQSAETECFRD